MRQVSLQRGAQTAYDQGVHEPLRDDRSDHAALRQRESARVAAEVSPRACMSRAIMPTPQASLASWRPSARLDAAEFFGRFEILGRIGRGGMAEILLARERSLPGATRHL